MGRRRKTSLGVSFFAFQDVITAVTGIVMVLVLLLAVELSQQEVSAEPEASNGSAAERADLKARVDAAEAEWHRLQAELARWNRLLANVKTTSPSGLREEIDVEERKTRSVAERLKQLRTESVRLSALLADKLRRDSDEKRRLERETAELRRELHDVQAEVARAQQRLQEIRSSDRVFYQMPRGDHRSGWVGVVSNEQVRIAPIGRQAIPRTLTPAAFLRFCRTAGAGKRLYVFLLIRPDGVETFDELQESLDRQGVAYGYDVIGSRRRVLDPRYGAAPP